MAEFLTRLPLVLCVAAGLAFAACDATDPDADNVGGNDVVTPSDTQGDANADGTVADGVASDDLIDQEIPYVVPNPDGKKHGEPCIDAAECQFLQCINAPSLTGGAFKICTKDCREGPNAPCNLEGADYTCARFSAGSGDDLTAFCTRTCTSLTDCPAGYGSCKIVNALKVCTAP